MLDRHLFTCFATALTLAPQAAWSAASALDPKVQAYLEKHCLKCHDAAVHKGDFRIDNLSTKIGFEDPPQWLELMERLNSSAIASTRHRHLL